MQFFMFLYVSVRRIRGEAKKCRKVYGIEHRDQWCTACRWKKACQRFIDWTEEEQEEEEQKQELKQAMKFSLTWWMFYTFWNQKYFLFLYSFYISISVFRIFLSGFVGVVSVSASGQTEWGSYCVTFDLEAAEWVFASF